jgi:hypothetical protein
MGVRKLSLAIAFKNGKNLADLTSAWLRHVKAQLQVVGVDPKVKLQVGDSASLVAPAALVAGIIVESGLPYEHRPLRVLLIGSDPFVRFDHSTWASMAGDLLGCPGGVEIFLNVEEEAISSGYPIAQALNLKHCSVISHSETRNCARDSLDLAIWIHPAAEALDDAEIENRITALHLAAAGVPTYASALNEADLLGQNYLLNEHAVELQPLGGELARGSRAINRFGISTTSLGVEGGWAAILTKVVPVSSHVDIQDVQRVKAALSLFCVEGAIHNSWSLGQHINGVAFNRVLPVGLIGNMSVDAKTGHLFSESDATKELEIVGHLWSTKLDTMPRTKRDLLLWACDVKLSFLSALPKEDSKRKAAINILEAAMEAGVLAAGVGLARAYEASRLDGAKSKAKALYEEVGDRHPMSAYALAYEAYGRGEVVVAERLFRAAASFGYPIAQTDLGKLLYEAGRHNEGITELAVAAAAGDPEANYVLGELSAKASQLQDALDFLRKAWVLGHAEAAGLAQQIARYMHDNGIGKRSLIKRELKEATSFITKLQTRAAKIAKEQERTAEMAKELLAHTLAKPLTPQPIQ